VVKEHAIPVACVMRELICRQCKATKGTLDKLVPRVKAILQASAARRYVSQEEDRALREFVDTMPKGHERYRWKNPWIRHETVGIPFAPKGTMDPQVEAALVARAGTPQLSAEEISSLYETLRRGSGTQASLDKLENRIRKEYPEVASIKLGIKHDPATHALAGLSKDLSGRLDLSGNLVKNGVKLGRDIRDGKMVLNRYLSYKNRQKFGAQITVVKETAESEMTVTVDYYRTSAKDANFRQGKTFPFDEFEQAAALYESYLVERLGVACNQA
jgi:hypothetical protein